MALALPLARIAVLIDAENIGACWCDALVRWLDACATTHSYVAFGDFSGNRLAGWKEAGKRHGIELRDLGGTGGKNGADIALTVAAMDMLAGQDFESFCIVSADSDFAPLARRIGASGRAILGIGKSGTPPRYRQAFDLFLDIESAARRAEERAAPAGSAPAGPAPAGPTPTGPAPKLRPTAARGALLKAYSQAAGADGWCSTATLGEKLGPGFAKAYEGCSKLSDVVRHSGSFECDPPQGPLRRIRMPAPVPATPAVRPAPAR